jgi:hypothetical protein
MTTTITSFKQSIMSGLADFVLGDDFHPIHRPGPRAAFPATLLVKFYFARGAMLYCLGQHNGSIRDFRTVLRMDWRHRGAAAWIAKAERANSRSAQG